VGTGQSEVEVAEIADVCVVVNAPGLGDDVQAIKAGVLEIADVLVVNKADSPLAELTVRQLRGMLELRAQTRKDVPIVLTTATENRGVADLHAVIASLVQRTPEEKRSARRRRARLLIAQTAAGLARRWVLAQSDVRFDALVEAVSSGETQLEEAAARALRWME
jgi:LAO/AO transport system kinase